MRSLCREVGLLPLHQSSHHVSRQRLNGDILCPNILCSTPETFDIVPTTVDIASRKNLAQISKMLTQITSGTEFSEESPAYLPVNDYVRKTIASISSWLIEGITSPFEYHLLVLKTYLVANVSDAEAEFHAHEFLDATVQARPIWISPNEVYSTHRLLSQHIEYLVGLSSPRRE